MGRQAAFAGPLSAGVPQRAKNKQPAQLLSTLVRTLPMAMQWPSTPAHHVNRQRGDTPARRPANPVHPRACVCCCRFPDALRCQLPDAWRCQSCDATPRCWGNTERGGSIIQRVCSASESAGKPEAFQHPAAELLPCWLQAGYSCLALHLFQGLGHRASWVSNTSPKPRARQRECSSGRCGRLQSCLFRSISQVTRCKVCKPREPCELPRQG